MAKLSSDKTYVTVEKGDTLSQIANDFKNESGGKTYQQLAAINNISDPDKIVVGQKIYLIDTSSTSSGIVNPASLVCVVKQFGIQSGTDNVLFVTWSWDKDNTANYKVEWYYATGDGVWFVGGSETVTHKQALYTIPDNARKVRVRIKAISKTHKVNGKDTAYWTCSWSGYSIYTVEEKIKTPETPTISIEEYHLTARLDNINIPEAKLIEFEVVKNDNDRYISAQVLITTNSANKIFEIEPGYRYKVRARACKDTLGPYSDWSNYSNNDDTVPPTPAYFKEAYATSEKSILLEWSAVTSATYTVEYTEDYKNFDLNEEVESKSGIEFSKFELTGLESGRKYYFRVKAVNSKGESGWKYCPNYVILGSSPSAPTTWSSTTSVIVGEPLTLYWVHNSEDGSSETKAIVEIYNSYNGTTETRTVYNNETDEDEKDKTKFLEISTKLYPEGTKLLWRVKTAGITGIFGGDETWSIQRSVDIYAPPTITLSVKNSQGSLIKWLTAFPIVIQASSGPNTQTPIGYHLSIVAMETYETVDDMGNSKLIGTGESVYSKFFNTNSKILDVTLSPGDVNLDNNINYKVICSVSMDSGLSAEASRQFAVLWDEISYFPNAEIVFDKDTVTTNIRPYCEELIIKRYKVSKTGPKEYTKQIDEVIETNIYGELIPNAITTTGEEVYYGTTSTGIVLYYCEEIIHKLIQGVTLSLYRKEYDGSFVELATGLKNTDCTFVTDPHPSLDYARYRVVAVADSTGAIGFYDVPGLPIAENSIIIQWDEKWSNFNVTNEDELAEPPWTGSMLKLPYDIDVSDDSDHDVELIDYIGRKYPVSYYGTKVGHTAVWSTNIPYNDKETLYGLRRLQSWMGDVYVREPSGSSYWATISVSFSQKHCDLKIPVTINITRVEGGK